MTANSEMDEEIAALANLFYPTPDELGTFEEVSAGELPERYQALLAHDDHMTVTVEAWFNSLVELRVLEVRDEGDLYARRILLALQRDGRPVQFGIMRIHLSGLPEIVRMEIQSQALPLGRIMIRHHLLREVELCKLWRVASGRELQSLLKLGEDEVIFGRTARILVEGVPAVELLEIVAAN